MKNSTGKILKTIKRSVCIMLLLSFALCTFLFAEGDTYQTENDPLVSLSYIEKIFGPELKEAISEELSASLGSAISADLKKQLTDSLTTTITEKVKSQLTSELTKTIKKEIASQIKDVEIEIPEAKLEYELMEFKKGDRIIAIGQCEIIIRNGDATAISNDAAIGLCDVTSGAELYNGYTVCKNHYVIIQSGDSRGIQIESETASVLIRGEYELEEQQ